MSRSLAAKPVLIDHLIVFAIYFVTQHTFCLETVLLDLEVFFSDSENQHSLYFWEKFTAVSVVWVSHLLVKQNAQSSFVVSQFLKV